MRPGFAVCAPMTPSTKAPSLPRKAPMAKQFFMLASGESHSRQASMLAKSVSR
jgi:hypothetical protein